ncbi:MAG: hypothetical protein WBB18_19415 [Nodosilinea sp.]
MPSTVFWVAVWFLLALAIRLMFLTSKPLWMDEVATVVFSLGNSTHSVPRDQVVSLDQLLTPLRPRPEATVSSAIHYLMEEDNHPPAYFALAHFWMRCFPAVQGLASAWAARALPALLGALSVPAVYVAGWLGFRSAVAGHISAALMAVSPFGVAMAQEARHYGMTTLMISLGLACFAAGVWSLHGADAKPMTPPMSSPMTPAFGLLWIGVNALAFATHYFAALALMAQALVLIALAWRQGRQQPLALWRKPWRRLYWVMLGTLASCLVWLPVLLNFYGSSQSSNLAIDLSQPARWLDPLAQTVVGLIFMVMTPITHAQGGLGIAAVVLSVLLLLPLLIGLVARLVKAGPLVRQTSSGRFGLFVMGGFVLAAIALFFGVSYGLAMDITRGHRYNAIFHPGVMVLLGGLLSVYWPSVKPPESSHTRFSRRRGVQLVWIAGLLSALFVVSNLAFAKYYEPAQFVRALQSESAHPILIGFPTPIEAKPTVIGLELLSIGWEIQRHFDPSAPDSQWSVPPRFFLWALPHNPAVPPEETLADILSAPPRPFDLWFLHHNADLSNYGCTHLTQASSGGHNYNHYECTAP